MGPAGFIYPVQDLYIQCGIYIQCRIYPVRDMLFIVFCVGESKAPPVLYIHHTEQFLNYIARNCTISHALCYIRGLAYALRERRPRRPFIRRNSTQTVTQTAAGRVLRELLVL